ncbi:MAG TPA: hypothetical protein VGL97_04490 [Bryobacteraceae bacterium]
MIRKRRNKARYLVFLETITHLRPSLHRYCSPRSGVDGFGRLGDQSLDALAGSLDGLFDFTDTPRAGWQLILDANAGTVVSSH